MKLLRLASVVLVCLFAASAQAGVTLADCHNDGDGAINCVGSWNGDYTSAWITGDQFWSPGHMFFNVTASDPLDPTIHLYNSVTNDSGGAWSGYQVNVYMNSTFSVLTPAVTIPGDWTAQIIQNGNVAGSYVDGNGDTHAYKASILLTGGTPVPADNISTLDFNYKMSFSGNINYNFTQEMVSVPVPEPATMSLLGLGLLGLLARRRRK
jgi:hypothetical protein